MFSLQILLLTLFSSATVVFCSDGIGFYRAEGTQIVDPSGEPFVSRGMTASGWLVYEAYALKLDKVHKQYLDSHSEIKDNILSLLGGSQEDADEFWNTFTENFFTESDVQQWAELGFNAVRLPFNYRLLSPFAEPDVFIEEGFELLDRVIGWCKTHGLAVLLDMHCAPGGQNPEGHGDPEYSYWYKSTEGVWEERGVPVEFEDNAEYFTKTGGGRTPESNQKRAADIWKKIAERYATETAILGYELTNEPHYYEPATTDEDLRNYFIQVTNAIREVDSNHIVFVEGNYYATSLGGLLPPFDENMAIAFHRYWTTTSHDDKIQEYLDARETHQVPFLLTESGENSNTWIYELKTLLEENDIGWFFWGWKKVAQISTANEILISEDYKYVIDNWRDSNPDSVRVKKGLMDLAEAVKTENCRHQKGYYEAMIDSNFGVASQQYDDQATIPGVIQSVNYDIGNQGIAYNDARYKNEEYNGEPWNLGWDYRNDGVDITETDDDDDPTHNGFHIFHNEDGDWLKYTVNVAKGGCYKVSFRVISWSDSIFELKNNGESLTGEVFVPSLGGVWTTITADQVFNLDHYKQTIELHMIDHGIDMGWMKFEEASCPEAGIPTAAPTYLRTSAPTVNNPSPNRAASLGGNTKHSMCAIEEFECGSVYKGYTMHKIGSGGSCHLQCAYFIQMRLSMGWECGPCTP